MGRTLIIVEKPSVAREYAKILGCNNRGDGFIDSDSYVIAWCVGHLVEMSYPDKYDERYGTWTLDDLPFLPETYKYEVIDDVKHQFNVLKKYMNDPSIDMIYYGGDSGREGEYIGRLVRLLSGVRKGMVEKRIWIDSFTEDEIKRGIREAKPLSDYDNLYYSATERAKEDYSTGINFTRALTLAYRGFVNNKLGVNLAKPITVGRVMTCVLGMVVDRERAIRNFVAKDYFKIKAILDAPSGDEVTLRWKSAEGSQMFNSPLLYNEEGFNKEEDAENFINSLLPMIGIDSVQTKDEKKNAPFLFNLAELQSQCSTKFKIGPDETLDIAQTLYEKKLTTYPRTDARVLSTAVAKEISKNISGLKSYSEEFGGFCDEILSGDAYKKIDKSRYTDDSKITDHYAIIPTGELTNISGLSDIEKKVFELICRRFLSIFYPPAVYSKTTVKASAKHDGYTEGFSGSAKTMTDPGFYKVAGLPKKDQEEKKEDDEEDEGDAGALKSLPEGGSIPSTYGTDKSTTKPPKRYTSGSIILAMENAGNLIEDEELRAQIKGSGVGTSATRAETIKKLNTLEYISTEKKSQALSATTIGETIYDVCAEIIPDLLSPAITAKWERGLEKIANGTLDRHEYDRTIRGYVTKYVGAIKEKAKDLPASERFTNEVICKCPNCGKDIIKGKKSYFCLGYKEKDAEGNPACTVGVQFDLCGAKITSNDAKMLFSGGTVTKQMKNKEGKTWQQPIKYSPAEKKVTFLKDGFESKFKCSKCGKMLMDTGSSLKCECGLSIWKTPGDKLLSDKDITDLLTKGQTGIIKGFKKKDKSGTFEAALTLTPEGKLSYVFNRDKK